VELLSGPVVTVLTALFSGLLLLHVHRLNARRSASSKFRSTIFAELQGVYPDATSWPRDIEMFLGGALPRLQIAVSEFRPIVPRQRRRNFDAAWETFLEHCKTEIPRQCDAANILYGGASTKTAQIMLRGDIDVLLSFAMQT
jgi:hypothetical protein